MQNVHQLLMGARRWKEAYEVHRKPFVQGDPNFGFTLKPPNAGTMTGPRVDHDYRRFGFVNTSFSVIISRRGDPQKRVVCRPREAARIGRWKYVRDAGGLEHARVFTKIWLSLFGLWSWRDDFGNESDWAVRLGRMIAAKGADDLWPLVASR